MGESASASLSEVDDICITRIELPIGASSIPYFYGERCLEELLAGLSSLDADRYVVITDDNMHRLYGDRVVGALRALAPVLVLSGPAGEGLKSLATLATHLERVVEWGATRRSVIVTLGGGVPGNLGGLAAALLFRGTRLVHVPTTIVAATDSVVSLKQAVNSTAGKNLFGAYHVPTAILLDLTLFETLPTRELTSGLCEIVKNCLVERRHSIARLSSILERGTLDQNDFRWLVEEGIEAKLRLLDQDGHERRSGILFEYGHTIGHAVELADQRARHVAGMSHGEAVGIGMVAAAHLSRRLGWMADGDVALHEHLVQAVGARIRVPDWLDVDDLVALVNRDNKRGYLPVRDDEAVMVLLRAIGTPLGTSDLPLVAVPLSEVRSVVEELVDVTAG